MINQVWSKVGRSLQPSSLKKANHISSAHCCHTIISDSNLLMLMGHLLYPEYQVRGWLMSQSLKINVPTGLRTRRLISKNNKNKKTKITDESLQLNYCRLTLFNKMAHLFASQESLVCGSWDSFVVRSLKMSTQCILIASIPPSTSSKFTLSKLPV